MESKTWIWLGPEATLDNSAGTRWGGGSAPGGSCREEQREASRQSEAGVPCNRWRAQREKEVARSGHAVGCFYGSVDVVFQTLPDQRTDGRIVSLKQCLRPRAAPLVHYAEHMFEGVYYSCASCAGAIHRRCAVATDMDACTISERKIVRT